MSTESQEKHCIRPIARNYKNFVYKGKKFPVSFDCLKYNSNYFYYHSENFNNEDIELQIEIDIDEDTLNCFIKCCENETFNINDSNVFNLDYLSKKYDVPELTKITKEYISKTNPNLAFQSLLFKYQLQKKKNLISKDDIQFIDTSNEEDIIGQRLTEYLNDDRLLEFPIPIIDRILKKYLNENNDDNIIEFLFKCLDKYKREASILFLNIKMDNQSNDLIIRLINDYSDIFDFNMVNIRSILNTSSELIKQLTKMKIEFNQKISEMNEIIEEQKNEIKQFNDAKNLINNDFKQLIQKQKEIIDQQINEIKENKKSTEDDLKNFTQKQKEIIDQQISKINENKKSIEDDFKSFTQKQKEIIEQQINEIKENKKSIEKDLNGLIQNQNRIIEEQNNKIYDLRKEIENQKNIFITRQISIKNKFIKFLNDHFFCNSISFYE